MRFCMGQAGPLARQPVMLQGPPGLPHEMHGDDILSTVTGTGPQYHMSHVCVSPQEPHKSRSGMRPHIVSWCLYWLRSALNHRYRYGPHEMHAHGAYKYADITVGDWVTQDA